MKSVCNTILAVSLFVASHLANAQALPPASRVADVQVGGTFSTANPDYTQDLYNLSEPNTNRWYGYGAYADIDFMHHFGVEFNFHNLAGSDGVQYERTYQIGGRYLYPVGYRFVPYARAMVGRGIFNFAAENSSGQAQEIANIGYNTTSFGGGLDFHLNPAWNIRVFDYEYQRWSNFPPKSLDPQVMSFGIAYHFHGSINPLQ